MTDPILTHFPEVMLRPDPSRTVVRPFSPEYPSRFAVKDHSRAQVIVDRILALPESEFERQFAIITGSLDERHRDVDAMLLHRFEDVCHDAHLTGTAGVSHDRKRLIGAYFSEEYSYEAAALFNPSVVLSPDQDDAPEGGIRFVMSLRGIGEGHVSSVTFRTGSWVPGQAPQVDPPSPTAVPPMIEAGEKDGDGTKVHLRCGGSREISETVLFPVLPSQARGIEDVRLCRFVEDDGKVIYYGTFTAFSGVEAKPEMLSGSDFRSFEMRPLTGEVADAKGMALFPRRINGRYAMLGRQDSENVWLHFSDDLYRWNEGAKLLCPHQPWEFVQMGNCGSPIEIDEGWLVLTHGVGTVRNYCVGAALLDKDDPSRVLGRTEQPILEPSPDERDGYVPNVVYSCGALVHGRTLLLPYGVADQFTSFASADLDKLVALMK